MMAPDIYYADGIETKTKIPAFDTTINTTTNPELTTTKINTHCASTSESNLLLPLEEHHAVLGRYNGNKTKPLTAATVIYKDDIKQEVRRTRKLSQIQIYDIKTSITDKLMQQDGNAFANPTGNTTSVAPVASFWIDIDKAKKAGKFEELRRRNPVLRCRRDKDGEEVVFVEDDDFFLRRDVNDRRHKPTKERGSTIAVPITPTTCTTSYGGNQATCTAKGENNVLVAESAIASPGQAMVFSRSEVPRFQVVYYQPADESSPGLGLEQQLEAACSAWIICENPALDIIKRKTALVEELMSYFHSYQRILWDIPLGGSPQEALRKLNGNLVAQAVNTLANCMVAWYDQYPITCLTGEFNAWVPTRTASASAISHPQDTPVDAVVININTSTNDYVGMGWNSNAPAAVSTAKAHSGNTGLDQWKASNQADMELDNSIGTYDGRFNAMLEDEDEMTSTTYNMSGLSGPILFSGHSDPTGGEPITGAHLDPSSLHGDNMANPLQHSENQWLPKDPPEDFTWAFDNQWQARGDDPIGLLLRADMDTSEDMQEEVEGLCQQEQLASSLQMLPDHQHVANLSEKATQEHCSVANGILQSITPDALQDPARENPSLPASFSQSTRIPHVLQKPYRQRFFKNIGRNIGQNGPNMRSRSFNSHRKRRKTGAKLCGQRMQPVVVQKSEAEPNQAARQTCNSESITNELQFDANGRATLL